MNSLPIISFIHDSFQEYEGHQSLVLFSKNCNLACPECYNRIAVCNNESIGSAIDILRANITPLHEAVVFLGGEPTIWENELIEALIFVKNKLKLKTKIFSNGQLPLTIFKLNERELVDAYSLDLKCIRDYDVVLGIKCHGEEYLTKLDYSIQNILEHKIPIELRTTIWNSVLNQIDEIKQYAQQKYPNVPHIFQTKFSLSTK